MVRKAEQRPQASEPPLRTPPCFEERIFPPQIFAAIFSELCEQGVDKSAALEGTGIASSQLDTHTTRISYQQLDIMSRNALRLSKDPAIALLAGLRMRVTTYGMYGYALMSSATPKEARRFSAQYNRINGPFCDLTISDDGPIIIVALEPIHWPNPSDDVHRFAVEFALSTHLSLLQDRAGQSFRFSRVSLHHDAPSYADAYARRFDCPILFDQSFCGYEYVLEDIPSALADLRTHAMARELCEQLLIEVNQAGGVAADIRRLLIERPRPISGYRFNCRKTTDESARGCGANFKPKVPRIAI